MAAEEKGEIPVRQAEGGRIPHPLPGPIREGDLRSGPLVEEDPGFARPAGRHIRGGVEMPAALDDVIVVAGGAGKSGRERKGRRLGGDDKLVGFVPQGNLVDRGDAAAGPLGVVDGNRRPRPDQKGENNQDKMGTQYGVPF